MQEVQDMLAQLEGQHDILVSALKRKHVSKTGLCLTASLLHDRDHKYRLWKWRGLAHLRWLCLPLHDQLPHICC